MEASRTKHFPEVAQEVTAMAGPVVVDPTKPVHREPEFGTATREDVPGFLGIMQILHQEPTSSAFARLLTDDLRNEDRVPLTHLFEEISTLALHRLIVEDLLFDAFAFDVYWNELGETVQQVRRKTGNPKFGENFEIAAGLARLYRERRPPKVRAVGND
jgi:hypothetical protein